MPSDVVEIKTEIVTHAAEHEVFLAFNGDRDAEVFHEWWQMQGEDSYLKYRKENP